MYSKMLALTCSRVTHEPAAALVQVDTVNGKKLDKPILIVVTVHHFNATRFDLRTGFVLPPKQRCVFKGVETGGMIGVP